MSPAHIDLYSGTKLVLPKSCLVDLNHSFHCKKVFTFAFLRLEIMHAYRQSIAKYYL